MTAYLSEDDGQTWPYSLQLVEGRSSYPDAAESEDGLIHIVYDVGRYTDHFGFDTSIRMAKVREADIIAGELVSDDAELDIVIVRAGPHPDSSRKFAFSWTLPETTVESWYFTGDTWSHLVDTGNWNSEVDGSGSSPDALTTTDRWTVDGRRVVIGNDRATFRPTLIVQGETTIGGYAWSSRQTFIENVVVNAGHSMAIRASQNGLSGIGITNSLELDGTVYFTNHTDARDVAVAIRNLTGDGLLYAGSTDPGNESASSSLDAQGDWSTFTGVVKFHNTLGWFRGSSNMVDLRSAQLFIEQADAMDQLTGFYLEKDIIVGELNLAGTVPPWPGNLYR